MLTAPWASLAKVPVSIDSVRPPISRCTRIACMKKVLSGPDVGINQVGHRWTKPGRQILRLPAFVHLWRLSLRLHTDQHEAQVVSLIWQGRRERVKNTAGHEPFVPRVS